MPRKIFLSLVALMVLALVSCTTTSQKRSETTPPSPPKPFYTGTEFPDIVVPASMKVDQEHSMIVRTQTYIGGVLTIKGRVKVDSLVEFFKNQLAARGWTLTGSIFYKNILLAFNRPNGSCFIYIKGSTLTTEAQIWASETIGE